MDALLMRKFLNNKSIAFSFAVCPFPPPSLSPRQVLCKRQVNGKKVIFSMYFFKLHSCLIPCRLDMNDRTKETKWIKEEPFWAKRKSSDATRTRRMRKREGRERQCWGMNVIRLCGILIIVFFCFSSWWWYIYYKNLRKFVSRSNIRKLYLKPLSRW